MLYIAVALFAVLFILAFVPFGKGIKKYKKGKKAANVFYTQDSSFFKRKLAAYKVFTFFTVFFCCLSIVASTILLARQAGIRPTSHHRDRATLRVVNLSLASIVSPMVQS